MFSTFEHDPPDSNDIILCAGPNERDALATALLYHTPVCYCSKFVKELHEALQKQTKSIIPINERFGSSFLRLGDAYTSFNQHLTNMDQVDVDRVLRHLHVLLIDRYQDHTGISELDGHLTLKERTRIFKDIIVPWIDWVRSVGQDKYDNIVSDKLAERSETDLSDTVADKKPDTTIDITTNKKPSNNNNTNMSNNTTTTVNMFESLTATFANMLGTLEPNMIRMTFDGKVAVKTTKGYKTYDVAKKKAVNMDSLVMPEMASFLLLPSTKVKVGDIILRDGAFYSIISVDDATNELIGYNYEAGKKETIVRETHCFLGNTYFYSKLFSPVLSFFGGKPKSDAKKEEGSEDTEATMSTLLPLAMMSQNGDMNSILSLMLMSKMENNEDSGMLKMIMLSNMMGGGNSNMNNLLPLMLMGGNFLSI